MKKVLSLFIVFSLTCSFSFAQKIWTLDECIKQAKQENLTVKQQIIQADVSKVDHQQSKQNLLPDLNMTLGQGFSFGRSLTESNAYENTNVQNSSLGISSGITLFDGLQMFNNIKKSNFDFQAALQDVAKAQDNIALQVMTYYLEVLYAKENLKLAEQQIVFTKEQLQKTAYLIESGRAPKGQLYEINAQLAQDEVSLSTAKNTLSLDLLNLAQLLYIEDVVSFDVDDNILLTEDGVLERTVDEIYQKALEFLPSVKAEELRIKSSETAIKVQRGAYMPQLTFSASYGNGYYHTDNVVNVDFQDQLEQNRTFGMSFNLSIPIFNRMSVCNNVKKANYNLQTQQLSLENVKYNLRKEIQQAYANAVSAREKIKLADANVTAYSEAYRYQADKYEAGTTALYEYNEAKNKLTKAMSEKIQAKFAYMFRCRVLAYYQGEKF